MAIREIGIIFRDASVIKELARGFRRRLETASEPRRVCGHEENGEPADRKNCQENGRNCYHPLYSDGKYHGPDLDLRAQVLAIFKRNGVNAVFSGHEHVYERLKPEEGTHYSILGSSAKLMTHDFRSKQDVEVGVNTERAFMIVEFAGDNLYFRTISRTRQTIDSGTVARR